MSLSANRRPLGKSGIMVSPIGWRIWRGFGDDVPAMQARLEAVLAAGINLVDTSVPSAPADDSSESTLGAVLAGDPQLRDKVVLASRGVVAPAGAATNDVTSAIDAALRRLQTDRIDLWQVARTALVPPAAGLARQLEDALAAGKIGAVGAIDMPAAAALALAAALPGGLASIQVDFSALETAALTDGSFAAAQALGAALLAASPLAGGRLGDGDGRAWRVVVEDTQKDDVVDALAPIGARHGVDARAAAYAWVMAHPARPIPIATCQPPATILALVEALKVDWSDAEWRALHAIALGRPSPRD